MQVQAATAQIRYFAYIFHCNILEAFLRKELIAFALIDRFVRSPFLLIAISNNICDTSVVYIIRHECRKVNHFLTSAFVLRASFEKKTVRGDVCAACRPVVGRAGRAETESGEFVRFLDEFARLLYMKDGRGARFSDFDQEDPNGYACRLRTFGLLYRNAARCVQKNAAADFDELVRQSGVDAKKNAATVARYDAAAAKARHAEKKLTSCKLLRGFVIFFTVVAFLAAALLIILYIAGEGDRTLLWIGIPCAVVGAALLVLLFTKLKNC